MNARSILRDSRDVPLLGAIARATMFAAASVAVFFATHAGRLGAWIVIPYLFALARVLGPFVLMQHQLMHRKTFTHRYAWIEGWVSHVLNPFFGQSFQSYSAHHVGMHHVEENGEADLSSTLGYRRDSARDFAHYFLRFFFTASFALPRYFGQRRRRKLMRRVLIGELAYFGLFAAAFVWNPLGAAIVLAIPLLVVRFGMISGNWVQHAFVDPARPAEAAAHSLVCLDTPYNELCFNDGYHIQHHEAPAAHFTELPALFEASRERLMATGAVIFRGLDYFQIWALLMRKAHGRLATHLDISPAALAGRTREDFLRSRLGGAPVRVPIPSGHFAGDSPNLG